MNPDLEKWIDEASKGLEPLAREKIMEQITEHYEDSVAGYRSSGLSEVEARSRAIIDLGNPRIARKRYTHTFLNLKTLKQVDNITVINDIFAYDILFPIISFILFAKFIFTTSSIDVFSIIISVMSTFMVGFYIFALVKTSKEDFELKFKKGIYRLVNYMLFHALSLTFILSLLINNLLWNSNVNFKIDKGLDKLLAAQKIIDHSRNNIIFFSSI